MHKDRLLTAEKGGGQAKEQMRGPNAADLENDAVATVLAFLPDGLRTHAPSAAARLAGSGFDLPGRRQAGDGLALQQAQSNQATVGNTLHLQRRTDLAFTRPVHLSSTRPSQSFMTGSRKQLEKTLTFAVSMWVIPQSKAASSVAARLRLFPRM